ncbi:MAG: hypothetical protein JWM89_1684, partial [Acidimicrobiales bacterium]|nr:hypothetical protein [Acidimicrobiales bacterium]
MGHDEASAGLLHEFTDTHLADRARLGDAIAFDELVRRHGRTAVGFATVVTGDLPVAREVAVRALTDVLDQIASDGYSLDDPYLPGLLRSVRELGNAESPRLAEANAAMDSFLPELARSTRWLTTVQGLDVIDTALALDIEDDSVAGLVAWTDELLGDRAEAVDGVLGSVAVALPLTFPAEARSTWRSWMATIGVVPLTRDHRERGALLPRIEPVASKILRGAAVLLLVAGAAGLVTNNSGSSGHGHGSGGAESATGAPHEPEPVSSQRSINSSGSTGRTGRPGAQASASTDGGSASVDSGSVGDGGSTSARGSGSGAAGSTGASGTGGGSGGAGGSSGGGTISGGTTAPGGGGGTTPGGGGGGTTPGGGGTTPPSTPPPSTPPPTTPPP